MRQRTLVAATTALATLGLVLTASAAPRPHAPRSAPAPAPARVLVDGLAGDWDADASYLTVIDPDVRGGSRAARRLLRARDEIDLGIRPATRIVTEDADGVRERIDADTLFADLDESADDLEVEATALVGRRAGRRGRAALTVTAKRIVLHLPADVEADPGDDPIDDPSAPGDDDPFPDDEASE